MILIIIFILIFFIFGLFYLLKYISPEYKGAVGESIIARKLNKLPEQEYKVFHNRVVRKLQFLNNFI
jgi:hypothetical protein